jgi:hypothetical protein
LPEDTYSPVPFIHLGIKRRNFQAPEKDKDHFGITEGNQRAKSGKEMIKKMAKTSNIMNGRAAMNSVSSSCLEEQPLS